MTAYPSDLEIANAADKKPIDEIAKVLGIDQNGLIKFGDDKAKLDSTFIDSLSKNVNGKLILVTAISPTPAGEGKTTTSVGLVDGLCHIGKKDWDEAILSIDRNLRDQEHSRYYGFKAAVLAHQGKIDEAKVCLDKYLEDRPEVKNSEDYAGVAPEFNEDIKNTFVKGMELAGLPKP